MKKFRFFFIIICLLINIVLIEGENQLIKFEFYSVKKNFKDNLIFSIGENVFHIVEKGDTLFSLSKKYGVSIEYIVKINNLIDNKIKIGQKLIIKNSGLEFYSLFENYNIKLKTNHILKIYSNVNDYKINCFSPIDRGIIKDIQYINGYGQTIFINTNNYMIIIGGFDSIGVKVGQEINLGTYIGNIFKDSNISVSIFKDKKILDLSNFVKK
ncbi:MAG: LysM peptidoglycan-binding domain-containing protein [Spirochaetes bacterium]|nr:LysM peptidoglycan-binding domain-containing protein [Spirochaetota bacterium]